MRASGDKFTVCLERHKEEDILPVLAQQLNRMDITLNPQKNNSAATTSSSSSVSEALQDLIASAFEQDATDIHFEPIANGALVRLRIDGIFREIEVPKILKQQYPATVSRIKIL